MTGSLFVTDCEAVDELTFCGVPAVVGSRAMSLNRRKRKRGIDRLKVCGGTKERNSLIDVCVAPSYAINALIRVSMDVRWCRPGTWLHCAGDETPMMASSCFRRLNIVSLRLNASSELICTK